MATVTTTRQINLGALGFPAYMFSENGQHTITADKPQAELQAAVDAAPLDTRDANETTLRDKARQALTANATYLALASPTNAQNAAQVKLLTRECNALIRLLLGALDTTDGT